MKKHLYVLFLLSLTLFTACGTQEGELLQLNLNEVDSYRMLLEIDQATSATIMNQSVVVDSITVAELHFDVQDIKADGTFKVQVIYDTVAITESVDEQIQDHFDSQVHDAPNNAYDLPMAVLVDKPFRVEFGSNAEIKDVSGFVEHMAPSLEQEAMNATMRYAMAETKEQEYLYTWSPTGGAIYPAEPVQVGSTWISRQDIVTQFVVMLVDNTFKVESMDATQASFSFTGKGDVSQQNKADMLAMMGAPEGTNLDISGDISTSGTLVINRDTGLLKTLEEHTNYTINMKVDGMELPMAVERTLKLTQLP